jgi:hypothetical protein
METAIIAGYTSSRTKLYKVMHNQYLNKIELHCKKHSYNSKDD